MPRPSIGIYPLLLQMVIICRWHTGTCLTCVHPACDSGANTYANDTALNYGGGGGGGASTSGSAHALATDPYLARSASYHSAATTSAPSAYGTYAAPTQQPQLQQQYSGQQQYYGSAPAPAPQQYAPAVPPAMSLMDQVPQQQPAYPYYGQHGGTGGNSAPQASPQV